MPLRSEEGDVDANTLTAEPAEEIVRGWRRDELSLEGWDNPAGPLFPSSAGRDQGAVTIEVNERMMEMASYLRAGNAVT